MRHIVASAVAGLLLATAAIPAFAGPSEREPVSTFVSTAGVDFQDPASVRSFYAALERTARQVCDSRLSDRSMKREDADCVRQTTDEAVARLARPMLTARHQARSQTAFARGY